MSWKSPTPTIRTFEAELRKKLTPEQYKNYCEGSLQVLRKKIAAEKTQERREFERKGTVYRHMQKAANGGVEPKSAVKRHHIFSTLYHPGTRSYAQ